MRTRTLAAAGLAVGLLAGCSDEQPAADATPTTQSSSPVSQAPDTPSPGVSEDAPGSGTDAPAGVEDALTALQTAADAVSGRPFDVERETRDGAQVWEIKVAVGEKEHELWISSDGTEVIDQRTHDKADEDVQKVRSARLSAVEALRKAAQQHAGSLEELEIDSRGGTVVWEVELRRADGSTIEVEVDATSGQVRSLDGE